MRVIVFFCFLLSTLYAAVDTQVWFYTSAQRKVGEHSDLYFEFEQRYRDSASHLYLYFWGIMYGMHLAKWFELKPGYRQFWINRVVDGWNPIHVPLLDGIFHKELYGFTIRNRCRAEYQIFEQSPNRWMYRNYTELALPVKLGKGLELQPIIFDELFFFEYEGFWQNRVGGGGAFHINDKLRARIFYMYRTLKILGEWQVDNVMYNLLMLKF